MINQRQKIKIFLLISSLFLTQANELLCKPIAKVHKNFPKKQKKKIIKENPHDISGLHSPQNTILENEFINNSGIYNKILNFIEAHWMGLFIGSVVSIYTIARINTFIERKLCGKRMKILEDYITNSEKTNKKVLLLLENKGKKVEYLKWEDLQKLQEAINDLYNYQLTMMNNISFFIRHDYVKQNQKIQSSCRLSSITTDIEQQKFLLNALIVLYEEEN